MVKLRINLDFRSERTTNLVSNGVNHTNDCQRKFEVSARYYLSCRSPQRSQQMARQLASCICRVSGRYLPKQGTYTCILIVDSGCIWPYLGEEPYRVECRKSTGDLERRFNRFDGSRTSLPNSMNANEKNQKATLA